MEDETSDTNLEWKKKGFESKETLTLKTNVKKALQYEATAKKPVQNGFSPLPSELPKGLKKIRKKSKTFMMTRKTKKKTKSTSLLWSRTTRSLTLCTKTNASS